MVNVPSKKSTCQLRLEERSLAYQQKQPEKEPERQQTRLLRAAEVRNNHQRALKARARARVQHAQRVAAEMHAKRRAEIQKSRCAVRLKVEDARARRRQQLETLQGHCKRRIEIVLEKVDSLKEELKDQQQIQLRILEKQLKKATQRRQEATEQRVRRLNERWQAVEVIKDRIQRIKSIQRWYRRQMEARNVAIKLEKVTASLQELSRSWDQIGQVSFEEAMRIMQNRDLARAAQAVLRVLLPSGEVSPKNVSPRSKSAPFRVLLMVGMLAAHPHEIMEMNPCPRLLFASKAVVRDLECILYCLKKENEGLKEAVARLHTRFEFYFESFALWKDSDAERLANEMLRGYYDIYRTKLAYTAQEIAHEGDGMHEFIHQTEKQLIQLRGALIQIIGKEEAMKRILEIETRCTKEKTNSDEEMSEGEAELSPEKECKIKTKRAFFNSEKEEMKEPPAQVESLLSDEALVHELILNPGFRLTNENGNTIASQVNKTMRKAFWDHVVEQNDVEMLLEHLELVRTKCVEVFKARVELVEAVDCALNPHSMRTMMADPLNNAVAIKERCIQVLKTLLQGEAPARNESTREFMSHLNQKFSSSTLFIDVLVEFLAFALEKMEEIQLDMTNVLLGMLATYLQRHGTEYEQKKFMKKLENGVVHMPMTDKWLAIEFESYWKALNKEGQERLRQGNALESSRCLRTSMLSLIVNYIDGSAALWPETFALDMERIRGFRDVMDRVTIIGSLLVITQNYLTQQRLSLSNDVKRLLISNLNDLLCSQGISGSQIVSYVMEWIKKSYAVEDAEFEMLLSSVFQQGNAVFTLFFNRIEQAIESVCMERKGQWSLHDSLASFESELYEMAMKIRQLFTHNEVVYATYYNTRLQHFHSQETMR